MTARVLRRVAGAVLAATVIPLLSAAPASAHPLDETVQQAYLTPSAFGLAVELDISPNVLVAPSFVAEVDRDDNGVLSEAECTAHAAAVQEQLTTTIDGNPVALRPVRQSYPNRAVLAAGGGTITLTWMVDLPATATALSFRNAYAPGRTVVQANVLQAVHGFVPTGNIERADDGRILTARLNSAATSGPDSVDDRATAVPGGASSMLDALRAPLTSPWALALLLAVCAALGALHALTPGHGKGLLVGYLVGDRGTPRQAIVLAATIAVTHTAAVFALGAAMLLAGEYVLPGIVVPVLTVAAGAVVLALGLRMVRRRWSEAHVPAHGHEHGHGHGFAEHGAVTTRPRLGIATMGVSAGIIPCPEALSVLLLAIGLHRTGLGLLMILAFSVGLAGVLVVLGLVLVSTAPRLVSQGAGRFAVVTTRIPLISAVVVTVFGAVMAVTGAIGLAG